MLQVTPEPTLLQLHQMSIGYDIVSSVMASGNIKSFIEAGFDEKWLQDRTAGSWTIFTEPDKIAYKFLLEHYRKYRKVPDKEFFGKNYPSYPLNNIASTAEEIIDAAAKEVKAQLIRDMCLELSEFDEENDIDGAANFAVEESRRISQLFSDSADPGPVLINDRDFDVPGFLDRDKAKGAPMGIPQIDEVFWGWRPGQLITLQGRQKAKKTWLMITSALAAWQAGYSILFYTVEMGIAELRERIYARGAGVSYTNLQRNLLTPAERQKVLEFTDRFCQVSEITFSMSQKSGLMTLNDVEREAAQCMPHVIYIDGVYFMKDRLTGETGSQWRANENISAELKSFALAQELAVVVSTQAQEKQLGHKDGDIEGKSIMGSTGLLKASDLVLGANRNEANKDISYINTVNSRFEWPPNVTLTWDWLHTSFEPVVREDQLSMAG